MSANAVIPDDMTAQEVESEMREASESPDTETQDEMPGDGPIPLSMGTFTGADEFHQGKGLATIYRLEDGSHVLRLEDFEVTNGPDLHVLLVPSNNPVDRDDIEGYVDLGSLKGNIGNQNYGLPLDIDPDAFGSVVIYCQPFHVLFSAASLSG